MSEAKHTPQAFPCLERGGNGLEMTDPGMSLRDYFAGLAISSIMAPNPVTGQFPLFSDFPECARLAYAMADAMLDARAAIEEPTK